MVKTGLAMGIFLGFSVWTWHLATPAEVTSPGFWDGGYTKAKSGIWDGDGTHAKSGVEGDPLDPGSSEGKSGVKQPPQTFFLPPQRYYENVDPDEIADCTQKDYSPYALTLIPQSFMVQGRSIPRGHYQIKLGDAFAGSPRMHLAEPPAENPNPKSGQKSKKKAPKKLKASDPHTFVIKQGGSVLGVLPVDKIENYQRKKGEKKLKKPIVSIVYENQVPILKYYFEDRVYSSVLEQ